MTKLLLIESPGKLKKLSQILGPGWIVKASMGHIRELTNEGEDALGFDLEGNSIHCHYAPRDPQAKKTIAALRQAVKQADTVYIATDPDREGETIGWHLQQALRLKSPHRVVYSEITPAAVRQAVAQPRELDQDLIAAGRARDCLDKLVGYKGSRHVVWPLNNGAKSMGRVQSAALHLIAQRDREIQAFVPQDYWSIWVSYQEGFKAFYRCNPTAKSPAQPAAKSPAKTGDDADKEKKTEKKTEGKTPESERVLTQAEANRLVEIAQTHPHSVISVEGTLKHQSPPPPFITSTLQQSAGAKLRFSPEQTMKVAQSLYEAGHITYMRTDSVVLSAPFCSAVKAYLSQHDPANVPKKTTAHRAVKGAQAAHEAIRPTDVTMTPDQMRRSLPTDSAALYEIIWNRAVASQCCAARLRKTRLVTQSGEAFWEARGQIVEFAGYSRYWQNISADSQLPALQSGSALTLQQAQAEQKQTQPPPSYSEPKLVQLMERKGIGRPSTYAPTIKTLKARAYVQLVKDKLQPTELGLALDTALEKLLPDLIQPEFTAQMEAELDAIAHGKQDWQAYLTGWHRDYFGPAIAQAQTKLRSGEDRQKLQTQPVKPRTINLQEGKSEPSQTHSAQTLKDNPQRANQPSKNQAAKRSIKTNCPNCQQPLAKIPSRSKKLKANHFLKCNDPSCDTVMFWNPQKKGYELPYSQQNSSKNGLKNAQKTNGSIDPNVFTNYPCPSCGALLVRHAYQKEGIDKIMLRCSLLENRRGKCKEVAFFQGREGFWSPKFGNLNEVKSI